MSNALLEPEAPVGGLTHFAEDATRFRVFAVDTCMPEDDAQETRMLDLQAAESSAIDITILALLRSFFWYFPTKYALGKKAALLCLASQLFAVWLEVRAAKVPVSSMHKWQNTSRFRRVYAHFLACWSLLCVWRVIAGEVFWNGLLRHGTSWPDTLRLWQLDVVGKVHTMYWISLFNYSVCPFTFTVKKVRRALEHRMKDTRFYHLDRDVSQEDQADVRLSLVLWKLFYPSISMGERMAVYRAAVGYYATAGTLLPREILLLSVSVRDSLGLKPVKVRRGRRKPKSAPDKVVEVSDK